MTIGKRRTYATLCGFAAIGLWASLALLTTLTDAIPPFALSALAFAVAAAGGCIRLVLAPQAWAGLRQRPAVWLVGVTGLFGFHALYFTALRLAPPAQAGLISYLWPLFLVIGSDLIVRGRPRLGTVVGGLTAFMGVAVLAAPGTGDGLSWAHVPGYACALGAALVWAAYSVASKRMVAVPTDCVTLFCLATAALSAAVHVAFEPSLNLDAAIPWIAIIGLGVGPVGAAFFLWDFAMKFGDTRMIGFGSFFTPTLSTGLLVAFGAAEAGTNLAVACVLIVAGSLLPRLFGDATT